MEDYRFYRWLDAFLQPASILAIVVLPIVWAAVFYEISEDQHRAEEQGTRTVKSIVRLLENHASRTIKRIDDDLIALQNSFPREPTEASLAAWLSSAGLTNSLQISFLDQHGVLRASNRGTPAPADLGERDYFGHFARTNSNDLYVGRASSERVTGSTSTRLARRLNGQDQEFAGIVVAAPDTELLDDFYNTLGAGSSVTLALLGLDGTLAAARGAGIDGDRTPLHWEHADGRLVSAAQGTSYGHYWTRPYDRSDAAASLIAYRMVEEYPLLVAAAIPGKRVFAGQAHSEFVYNATGWSITLALLAAIYLATSRELKFKAAARSLADTNARFRASLANMPHGLCMFDQDQRLLICNERYADMYRVPKDMMRPGTTLLAILQARIETGSCPVDGEGYIISHLREVESREPRQLICELRDGRTIAIDYQPMADGGFVTVHQDITQQKASEAKIAFLAHHDPLTGLLNRASLLEKIEEHLALSHRHGGGFALLLLDLDRFKQVNDGHGHPAGDALLQLVAARLKSALRQTDVLARLGGDEFAVLQSDGEDANEAAQGLAARLIEIIGQPFNIDRSEISIGTSIGIAFGSMEAISAGRLMKMADLALYRAKAQGRNRFSVFDASLEEAANVRNALESELRAAVLGRAFVLHYQPILDANTGLISGAEALIRWQHDTLGWVEPARFIPLAEESGLIGEIGQWVLQTACCEAATWPSHTKVAVNISAIQLRDPMIVDYVICALAQSGLPPERLELEITETALIDYGIESHEILRQFKALGLTIALDDFGTGYSSLSQLTMFPFDKIKIDRSFTSQMTSRSDCAAVIAGVLALAKSLDIATTAEGVETLQQYRLLKLAGVSCIQGYLIQRPHPAAELDFNAMFSPEENARVA